MTVQSKPSDTAAPIDLGREADFKLGPLTVHPSTCEIEGGGRRETMQPRAMQVLVALARARGAVVSRDRLIELCWEGRIVGEDAINRAIAKVRAAAELTDPPAFEVETIPRVGFRLKARQSPNSQIDTALGDVAPATATAEPTDLQRAGATAPSAGRQRQMLIAGIGSLVLTAVLGAALWLRSGERNAVNGPVPQAAPDSIAVLPFLNMSGDPAKEYFSDGFSEELLNDLSNTPQLRVAARTSSFSFKGKKADIPEIARKLRVRTVLEGSVRESGDRVRITAQLIDAASGYHLWSQTYDRQLTDILQVQDEIARSIARTLAGKLLPARTPAKKAIDPEAYRKYLLGRLYFERITRVDNDRAIALFREVTLLQPDFSDGFAMLGYAYFRRRVFGQTDAEIASGVAQAALAKALALNPQNPTALIVKLDLALSEQDWNAASGVIRRMQQIDARNATVARALGHFYLALGFPDRAIAQFRLATKFDPLSAVEWGSLGIVESMFGHNAAAISAAEAALALAPDTVGLLGWLCAAKVARGQIPEAEKLVAKLERTPEGRQLKGCAMALARASGNHAKAVQIVDDRVKNNQGDPAYMAQNYLELGEYQKAFPLLRRAYDEGDTTLYILPSDPATPRAFLKTPEWKELTQRPRFRIWTAAHDRLAAELGPYR